MFKKLLNFLLPQRKDIIPFHQGFDLTGLPVVTLYQGDKKLNFLLDTGATLSIIDSNIIDTLNYKPINEGGTILSGIEGKPKNVNSCIVEFSYKNTNYETVFLSYDMSPSFSRIKNNSGVTLHGILGSEFFRRFQYILDFAELTAYSKK